MSDESADTYFEVQVDRETVVLAAVGFAVLIGVAYLFGYWRGSRSPADDLAGAVPPALAESGPLDDPAESGRLDDPVEEAEDPGEDEVDGEPLFGSTPVSAKGAPPISAVPGDPVAAPVAVPAAARREAGPTKSPGLPPAPAAGASAARSGWVVQVLAVTDWGDAGKLERDLTGKGYPVRVSEEGGYFKVQVGPYGKKDEAEEAERRLKREEKLGTWVKRS